MSPRIVQSLKELNPSAKKALSSALVVLSIAGIVITGSLVDHAQKMSAPSTQAVDKQGSDTPLAKKHQSVASLYPNNPFASVSLNATSAYVYDLQAGKTLYAKNATTSQPLASITKIMSAVTASEEMPEYAVVPVKTPFLSLSGDNGLYGNERWKLSNLLDFSLVTSSNDGIAAIAAATGATIHTATGTTQTQNSFVRQMNRKAAAIGLRNTQFHNVHGLDQNESTSGAYSTAQDTARLMAYALTDHYQLVEPTRYKRIYLTSLSDKIHDITNTNDVITQIPGILASKTGYTDLSGGNLVVAFDAGLNRPVIAVVFGSTYGDRFSDMLQLVDATIVHMAGQGSTPRPNTATPNG